MMMEYNEFKFHMGNILDDFDKTKKSLEDTKILRNSIVDLIFECGDYSTKEKEME